MATYSELWDLQNNSALRNKIIVAVAEAARIISAGEDTASPPWNSTNGANRKIWAKEALMDPLGVGEDFILAVLVKNKAASVAAIQGASDTAVQTNVNELVDLFAQG